MRKQCRPAHTCHCKDNELAGPVQTAVFSVVSILTNHITLSQLIYRYMHNDRSACCDIQVLQHNTWGTDHIWLRSPRHGRCSVSVYVWVCVCQTESFESADRRKEAGWVRKIDLWSAADAPASPPLSGTIRPTVTKNHLISKKKPQKSLHKSFPIHIFVKKSVSIGPDPIQNR